MVKTHTQNVLALSVVALVASGVAAFAGVATFNNDLTGRSVYLGYEMHDTSGGNYPMGDYSGGSAYPTGGGTSGGAVAAPAASATLSCEQAKCGADFRATDEYKADPGKYESTISACIKAKCTSTSTATSTTVTVTNRCAYVTEEDGCMAKCTCYVENTSSCSSPKAGEAEFCNAVKGADVAKTGKTTGVFNMTTCSNYCDELKAVPPPAPAAEPVPVEPVSTLPLAEPAHTAAPVFEDQPSLRELRPASNDGFGGGGYDGFGDFRNDVGGEFHGGPGDFDEDFMGFGGPDDFGHFEDFYDMEFDLEMMQEGFDKYFDGFGPGMGGKFGDDFGVMPEWMKGVGKEILETAGEFCSEDVLTEIRQAVGDGDFGAIESMMIECNGGDMGGEGPPDPEMMENAAKMLQIFGDKDGPVYFALSVAKKHDVFTDAEVGEIEDILVQIGEKAEEAEKVCMDLPDMGGDFLGFKGFLAQLFDDEEEDDDDEGDDFFDDGDENDGEGDDMREAFEACGSVLDEALGAGPGQDEEEMGSGLMGELEGLMREPMEAAVEDGTIPQEEWDEVEDRFDAVMEDLDFEGKFEKGNDGEDFRDFDEGEDEEEGGGEFSDEDFDF